MVTPYKLYLRDQWPHPTSYIEEINGHTLQVIFKRSMVTPYKLYLRDQWSHPTSYI